MAQQDTGIQLPGGFGGLTRFKEEYDSVFKLKPVHIIGFVILIILFVIALNIIHPLK